MFFKITLYSSSRFNLILIFKSASYTLAGISSKVRLGCKENCVSGSLVPIDIQGIEAALECCDEMYCNKSNKLVFNGLLLASLLLSFLFSSFC